MFPTGTPVRPENSKVLQVAGAGSDTLFASRIDPADP